MMMLKSALTFILMTTLVFGGGYWYYTAFAGCDVPIGYRIGSVDERFLITNDRIRNAISTAESLWEDGTDRNLFTYDPNGSLVVNFVYDERQALVLEEAKYKDTLDKKENVSEDVKSEFDTLTERYETLRTSYESRVATYEKNLNAYNGEVESWNTRGGAPKDVHARLEATQDTLVAEEVKLNKLSDELNTLARKINALGSKGNTLVSDYNSLVEEYNSKFGEAKEFTQGEYTSDSITIYEFENDDELAIVLAHELGHALDIDHVEKEASIMYERMGGQSLTMGLTEQDVAAFAASCGSKGSMFDTLEYIKTTLLGLLGRL